MYLLNLNQLEKDHDHSFIQLEEFIPKKIQRNGFSERNLPSKIHQPLCQDISLSLN